MKKPVGRPRKTAEATPQPAAQPQHAIGNPYSLLRVKQILEIVPVAKSTWWQWVSTGIAPQPIRMGSRCTCWKSTEVLDFVKRMGA